MSGFAGWIQQLVSLPSFEHNLIPSFESSKVAAVQYCEERRRLRRGVLNREEGEGDSLEATEYNDGGPGGQGAQEIEAEQDEAEEDSS